MTQPAPRQRPGKKVLVVDDDAELRATLAEWLQVNGFRALEATNGLEALLQVKRNRPDAVILDLAMPRLGGIDTLKWIRSFDPGITVLVVTGLSDDTARARALELGASVVLPKPPDFDALLARLAALPDAVSARVLVVDDDPGLRALLEEFLGNQGYDVSAAADGPSALRAIEAAPPDVVILDITMPGLSGVEALPAIRALAPGCKVIMLSGTASPEVIRLALTRGAFDYFVKPCNPDHLTQAVDTAVAMRRLET